MKTPVATMAGHHKRLKVDWSETRYPDAVLEKLYLGSRAHAKDRNVRLLCRSKIIST